jgi:hypothetical protein
MRRSSAIWSLAMAILSVAPVVRAQSAAGQSAQAQGAQEQGGENPFAMPEMRRYWNPTVDAGAVYEVTSADGKKKRTEEYAVLSEETVEGKKAYWLEFSVTSPNVAGKIYEKTLVIPAEFRARKVIVQFPGMAAMEMPAAPSPKADAKDATKLAGNETITVPGGTFECEHWRDADGTDTWVSAKVGPMKVVKSVGKNETRVLLKTIGHPKDSITGPVKAFDPELIKNFAEKQRATE